MSNIQFHTLDEEPLRVEGPERAQAALTAVHTAISVLGADEQWRIFALTKSGVLPEDALSFTTLLGKPPTPARHGCRRSKRSRLRGGGSTWLQATSVAPPMCL